jgi:Tol biopolymer transport system component
MVANADGSGARKLAARKASMTYYTGAYSMVRWSPDGQRIAALVSTADPSGQTDGLVEIDVATSREKPMPGGVGLESPTLAGSPTAAESFSQLRTRTVLQSSSGLSPIREAA